MDQVEKSVKRTKVPKFLIKKRISKGAKSTGVKRTVIKRTGIKKIGAKGAKGKKNYSKSNRGVIFVKHIPHGFFEPQMKRYFEQFGHVTRIRLSRSKRTGRSKGYAYVEFSDESVARITADAMKDYLMFRHRMICQYLPRNEVHRDTFKRWNIPFKRPRAHLAAIRRHNQTVTEPKKEEKRASKLEWRNVKRLEKIKQLGVDYVLE